MGEQPSPALLASLGIKVRDFAYENTLPAIVPVPRVPRQVQPAPRPRKRPQSDGDDPCAVKKPKSLERKPTEPLQESPAQHSRTLGRITFTRVCSIIIPPSHRALPARLSASPTTSPLTPPLSPQHAQLIQASPPFPFVVHVDDTTIATSQTDPESQPVAFRPTLFSMFTLDPCCSPAPNPQNTSPVPLPRPFLDIPSPKELEADPRVRKRRNCGVAGTISTPGRYQLRQRPISNTRSLLRRTRPMQ